MNFTLAILLTAVGFLYLYEWAVASNRCKAKWLMFTPFWFLMLSRFDEGGQESCKRALVYVLIGLPISLWLIFRLEIW